LEKAFIETNSEVYRRGQANSDFRNMGTTASVMVMLPQGALIGHIGDSRVYRARGNKLEQVTFDHSLVWELRRNGQLPEDAELASAIPKNVITRSVGPNSQIETDIEGPLPIEVGDTFLLCSDGLTGRVTDEELAAFLPHLPPAESAQLLVDLANLRGGPDNITVIVARVVGDDLATQGDAAEPLKTGVKRATAHPHPAVLVAVGAFLLIGLLLGVIGQPQVGLVAAIVGAIIGLVAYVQYLRSNSQGVALGETRRRGSGPYSETPCPSPAEVSESLATIVAELRLSPAATNLDIDWSDFDASRDRGADAQRSDIHGEAIREYTKAVCLLMQHVRDAMNKDASDSSIEL
jgi:protein phosphatase